MMTFPCKKLSAPKSLTDTQMMVPHTESNLVKTQASVWLLPLTDIHHLEWFNFSNLSQLTSQMQAQQSQTADSLPFGHSGTIDTY